MQDVFFYALRESKRLESTIMGRHNDEQFSKKYGGNGTDHARVDVSKRVQYANDAMSIEVQ